MKVESIDCDYETRALVQLNDVDIKELRKDLQELSKTGGTFKLRRLAAWIIEELEQ